MPQKRDQRASNAAYYAANRQREIDRVRRRQEATIAFLRSIRDIPCADCAQRFEPYQMDFDHRDPVTKGFNLCGAGALLKSRAVLLQEVAKCDVVCANCHRLRTRNQHRARLAVRRLSTSGRTPEKRARWRYKADLLDQLRSVPCADCGGTFPQCCMDFDHRDPSEKRAPVPGMIARFGIRKILAEVDKCDIVCANCHRKRTFERRSLAA